ncbi:MAG: DUF3021 family protein [Clostridiales bacterium]|jgi:hypothetical protein|nr:DUF3021 family protein [Clostridiales bacterium]
MKKFIKKLLMFFGLASISATVIPAIVNSYWEAAIFAFQLLFMLLVVFLLQLLTEKLSLKIPLLKYFIDLVITLSVGLSFGWIWKWYEPSYAWMMFAMIIPVYVIGYFLDIVKVKKDVKVINQQIKRRREKLRE